MAQESEKVNKEHEPLGGGGVRVRAKPQFFFLKAYLPPPREGGKRLRDSQHLYLFVFTTKLELHYCWILMKFPLKLCWGFWDFELWPAKDHSQGRCMLIPFSIVYIIVTMQWQTNK